MDRDEYDPIEHLAKTLDASPTWGDLRVAMFTAAFDASGEEFDPNQPCLAVAGFISEADRWMEFSVEWKAALRDLRLPFFRTAQHKHVPAIMAKLVPLIPPFVFTKVGVGVVFADYASIPADIRKYFRLNAYAVCGLLAIAGARAWAKENGIPQSRVVNVFEKGDAGADLLRKAALQDGLPEPLFKDKKDAPDKNGEIVPGYAPLQAADLVAHELFQQIKTGKSGMFPYPEIERLPGKLGVLTKDDIDYFISLVRRLEANGINPYEGVI